MRMLVNFVKFVKLARPAPFDISVGPSAPSPRRRMMTERHCCRFVRGFGRRRLSVSKGPREVRTFERRLFAEGQQR